MALTIDTLREDVAGLLGEDPEDIPLDENLVDYGLDSIRLMALVSRWRETHGAEIEFADLAGRPALEEWAKLLGLTPH
ncbi:phosphopantetheine-binding protein [Streptomyces albidoflavus]|uniref:phosphopantetheine-binding protein n=1 Tax=Streptomyces albidoflavus TaxID=1886 RepID=UPI00101E2684|nr:phosphopantetheine-binding protein [Streptomyces albidoflavus]RZE96727.1 isochorismatase [Streptomyces albidoflavus]RZE98179.1 isochorismatase [Streptomyces albidoflavus]